MWSFEKLFGESFSSGDERIRSMRNEKGEIVSDSGQSMAGFAGAKPPYFEEPLKKKLARRRRKFAACGGQRPMQAAVVQGRKNGRAPSFENRGKCSAKRTS
jgi:hypothetical protein